MPVVNTTWYPNLSQINTCQLQKYKEYLHENYQLSFANYQALHRWSINERETFWHSLWCYFNVIASKKPLSILEYGDDMLESRWFMGAQFNFAENLLRQRDTTLALITFNEQGLQQRVTYKVLAQQVAKVADYLRQVGVVAGDRVAAVLPNGVEAVVAMLATVSIGAIWSACSPEFGAEALLDRFGQIKPKILFAVDQFVFKGRVYDLGEKLVFLQKEIGSLETIILKQSRRTKQLEFPFNAIDYNQLLKGREESLQFVSLPFDHPLYILYTSGTTGKPKCIVHGAGGVLLQHLKELSLHTDLKSGDRLLFYTTCGWMMWNWQVSSLALGVTLCLYDGSPLYPEQDSLLKIIRQVDVTHFGTSASYLAALANSQETIKLSPYPSLRSVLSTGSPLLPSTYDFIYQTIKKDVLIASISGGSDIISCFMLGNPQLPVYKGQLQCIGLGMDVRFYNEHGSACEINQAGELVCTQSFPSQPIYFWEDRNKTNYKAAYFNKFPGVWSHGDYGLITQEGGIIIQGRSDAVLNPGGVRIGTAEIYQQVAKVQEVSESLVIMQDWQGTQRIILFVVLQSFLELDQVIKERIKTLLLHHASPRHVPKKIIAVKALPKTMNGKLCELAVKDIVHGKEVKNKQSLLNPEALSCFKNLNELMTE